MKKTTPLSDQEIDELILSHKGWAESIAKSVARGWDLDWQLDGLDGAAFEALIFCARRFQPDFGVPFKGYARKRIHEASSDTARKCKGWQRDAENSTRTTRLAREVSAELFNVFPHLRSGFLTDGSSPDDGEKGQRIAIQQLLIGASIIATKQGLEATPDEAVDYKRVINFITALEPIHQLLLWKVYWEGFSLRSVASEWDTDELNVIREHKVLLDFLQKSSVRGEASKIPRVRPGLKDASLNIQPEEAEELFGKFVT